MRRCVNRAGRYFNRAASERKMFAVAMNHYFVEVTSTKKSGTQRNERLFAEILKVYFGKFTAIRAEIALAFRDTGEEKRPRSIAATPELSGK